MRPAKQSSSLHLTTCPYNLIATPISIGVARLGHNMTKDQSTLGPGEEPGPLHQTEAEAAGAVPADNPVAMHNSEMEDALPEPPDSRSRKKLPGNRQAQATIARILRYGSHVRSYVRSNVSKHVWNYA